MNRVAALILRAAGAFCLACGLLPPALYRIFNAGTAAMLLLGGALLALPPLWKTLLAPHPRLRTVLVAAGWAGLLFCACVSGLMVRRGWFCKPPDTGELSVIVLGGKVNGDRPSLMLARRLEVAAGYLGRNPEAVCVVSGGQGPDEDYPEAVVMERYLVEIGVEPERILVEQTSANTRQNLRRSRRVLEAAGLAQNPVVLVTDSFHQLRASVFAGAEGLSSYNLSSLTPWGLMPSYWLREILGVSWAWVSIRLQIA